MTRFLPVSGFAMLLAAAGLPLYIHLPRYAATELGLGLGVIGAVLIGIRVMDFAQDPALGWLIDRFPAHRSFFAALAALGMAVGFVMLFSLDPVIPPIWWLTLSLVLIFSAFSLGSILFYGQTAAIAGSSVPRVVFRLAAFREVGTVLGIVLAAMSPDLLSRMAGGNGYGQFGWVLAVAILLLWLFSRPLWSLSSASSKPVTLRGLAASGAHRLLLLAFVNALPVAITSTLFLFFVEDKLGLGDMAGAFLVLFFASAGLSMPVWTRLLDRIGGRRVLILAMGLAIAGFAGTVTLAPGAAIGFALITIVTGAALGADMVVLPAMYAIQLERAGLRTGQAFGIWAFATKLALAIAAVLVLPMLGWAGFQPGMTNNDSALFALTLAYAVLPCLLKLCAVWLAIRLPEETANPGRSTAADQSDASPAASCGSFR
ncbi:MFS transporter [Shimia biformata]|uniref:MFS transporter n=1 Tax=Shimia biformata TaxID=1294299 RepID=UPI00194FA46B|nr:MFS transporter [Shimia biformata]